MIQYFQFKNGTLRRIDDALPAERYAAWSGSRYEAWDRSLGALVIYA